MNLNIPEETKEFLCNKEIEEDEFYDINIKFFGKESGVLCDVVEWTKINDSTVGDLSEKFVVDFFKELEKFRNYYVIAENLDSGNLIAIKAGTGEIYELEHEVIEEIEEYYVNSSLSKMYESMKCFKEIKNKTLELREQGALEEIEILLEKSEEELRLIDSKVIINDEEDNIQFWNVTLENYREWCLD